MNFFSNAKREVTQITEGHAIAELSKPLGGGLQTTSSHFWLHCEQEQKHGLKLKPKLSVLSESFRHLEVGWQPANLYAQKALKLKQRHVLEAMAGTPNVLRFLHIRLCSFQPEGASFETETKTPA